MSRRIVPAPKALGDLGPPASSGRSDNAAKSVGSDISAPRRGSRPSKRKGGRGRRTIRGARPPDLNYTQQRPTTTTVRKPRRGAIAAKQARFHGPAVAHALLRRHEDFAAITLQAADAHGYIGYQSRHELPVRPAVALVAVASQPLRIADARSDAKAQVEFGINVAQRGLWREAIYRWERAVEIDPTYAAAFNDLAVGYEHEGQLDKARKAYEKALELEPDNPQIRQNYELFKEINDRTSAAKEKP